MSAATRIKKNKKRKSRLTVEVFGSRDKGLCRAIADLCLTVVEQLSAPLPAGVVNIIIVNNRFIQELNQRYRRRNRPTDVLSFPLYTPLAPAKKTSPLLLGEIYISREKAKQQAAALGIPLRVELLTLVRHGLLHLAGLSHAEMKKLD